MKRRSFGLLLSLVCLTGSAAGQGAPTLPSGLWDATVTVNGIAVPFHLELSTKGRDAAGAFFNGEDRVRSTSGTFAQGTLSLQFEQYASLLTAQWADGHLVGTYGRAGQAPYVLDARPHVAPSSTGEVAPNIAGQWEIPMQSPKGESAWRLFVRQTGSDVSASILRVDGDTGALDGSYQGGKFVLSHFSGARPMLLEITPNADGTLSLLQNHNKTYTAVKSSVARAKNLPEPADPSRWTSVKDPTQPLRFSGRDLNGKQVTEADARFKHKVVLVSIMGSWCPNCHDEAPFLAELYKKYRAQGLEIVSLAFEDTEQLKNPTRLRAFLKTYGITYSVLLVGEPSELGARLPQAVNLNTWPATFFVGRDGLVRGAHAGFAGKATGPAHTELIAEIEATVQRLLAEKP